MSRASQGHDPGASLTDLWESHLRLQAARVPDRPDQRGRSAELLDVLFFAVLDVLRPAHFVEAGAFEATTSLRVRETFPEARVVAFEANPDTHRRFSNVHDYAGHGVDYRCLALTDLPGPVSFHREDPTDLLRAGSSSLLDRNRTGEVWVPETSTAEVVVDGLPLDDALGALEGRGALWVDVEGAARQVLAGAARTLDACALVKIEVEDAPFWAGQWRSHEVIGSLLEYGFVPLARDAEYPQQFNVVLARPDLARDAVTVQAVEEFLRSPLLGSRLGGSTERGRVRRWIDRLPGRVSPT
jgi:FkbM family methyltransferase